jgi:hypothetical protein
VRLKWGPEHKGLLVSTTNDMNVQLAGTEGEFKGNLGKCVVRPMQPLHPRRSRGGGQGIMAESASLGAWTRSSRNESGMCKD